MKISKTLRLPLGAVVLLVAVGAIWWIVGYPLGKTILAEVGGGGGFRSAFGFNDGELGQLFFLTLLALIVRQITGDAGTRWLRLAGVAGVAALVAGGGKGEGLVVVLFVFAAAAVAEAHAVEALLVALVGGAVVAFASVLGAGLELGPKLLVTVLRDLFYFAPLLFGPELLDGLLWKKVD
jgi:hypothetical protein